MKQRRQVTAPEKVSCTCLVALAKHLHTKSLLSVPSRGTQGFGFGDQCQGSQAALGKHHVILQTIRLCPSYSAREQVHLLGTKITSGPFSGTIRGSIQVQSSQLAECGSDGPYRGTRDLWLPLEWGAFLRQS
jgi:hypothetical protein